MSATMTGDSSTGRNSADLASVLPRTRDAISSAYPKPVMLSRIVVAIVNRSGVR